jgi:hypothetical protein
VLSILGTFGIVAAVVFTAICFGVGWVLGGPGADTRGVLSLGTAQRNTAAALVVAGQNFSDARVVVMITVVMIVSFAMLMPLSRVLARRPQPVVSNWTRRRPGEHWSPEFVPRAVSFVACGDCDRRDARCRVTQGHR